MTCKVTTFLWYSRSQYKGGSKEETTAAARQPKKKNTLFVVCLFSLLVASLLYERCSPRAFSVALGLHHRLLLPHRGPKHTGHVVRQRGHLSGIWSAVLSHSRSQTPFPSKWPGLPPAGIHYSRITGWVYLALAEISVEALASPCPRTMVPSAVTCFLAWLGVFPTIPSDSTHVFRPHLQVTGSSNSTQRIHQIHLASECWGAPGFDPLSFDFAVKRATIRLRCTPSIMIAPIALFTNLLPDQIIVLFYLITRINNSKLIHATS